MAGAFGQLGRSTGNAVSSFFDPRAQQAGELAGLQQVALGDTIGLNRMKAAALAREEALKSPQSMIARTLMGAGVPTEAAPAVGEWLDRGRVDRFDTGGQAGPVEPAPSWYTPELRTRIGQQFAGAQAVQAGEANSLKDYSESQGAATLNTAVAKALAGGDVARVSQLTSKDPMKVVQSLIAARIGSGELGRDVGGGRMAAIEGKPLYNADATGAVLDQYGGQLDTSNPLAGSTINLRTQQGAQAKAGAVENYAQAGAANAAAGLSRARTGVVGTVANGKVPVGYRYVTDQATGEPRLEPIPGGPKDPNAQTGKPLQASAAKALLENQTNLRRAESALALAEGKKVGTAEGDAAATGWKGLLPNQVLNRMDPKGVDTRAAISDLGSLVLHDRSGAAVTAAEFPRLAPFIPTHTDDAATVKKKLASFVRIYKEEVGQSVDFFRASGYNVPAETLRSGTGEDPLPADNGGIVAPPRDAIEAELRRREIK